MVSEMGPGVSVIDTENQVYSYSIRADFLDLVKYLVETFEIEPAALAMGVKPPTVQIWLHKLRRPGANREHRVRAIYRVVKSLTDKYGAEKARLCFFGESEILEDCSLHEAFSQRNGEQRVFQAIRAVVYLGREFRTT